MNNGLIYIVGNYAATGEGMTVSMLVTRAYPAVHQRNLSREDIALEQFSEVFGEFFGVTGEVVTREEFTNVCGQWLPQLLLQMIEEDAWNIRWFSQVHVNLG